MAGALMREHPDLHMQTHLSENHAEIAFTQELYPVVARLHRRLRALRPARPNARCSATASICPNARRTRCRTAARSPCSARPRTCSSAPACSTTSAIARGEKPLRIAAATDVGGGTNYSMLRTMDEGYKVIALNGEKLNPFASFWQLTRGNAEALSIADKVGTLEAGTDADIVVLDSARDAGDAAPDGDGEHACRGAVPAADAGRRPGGGRGLCRRQAGEECARNARP